MRSFRFAEGGDAVALNRGQNIRNGKQYCAANTTEADEAGGLPRRQGAS
ncbi:MAG TPA: hypothetical protein VMP11_17235 [Verrucomicrobiae bacterium]|nr:hypothetical protein [Verrucomicrobiae bacterium]